MIKNNKRCVIVTAYSQYPLISFWEFQQEDFIICADGGLDLINDYKVTPDVVIGDFDSSAKNEKEILNLYGNETEIIKVKSEKDETDTLLCIKHAISLGYDNVVLLGGLGGRFDHTIGNLQGLSYFLDESLGKKEIVLVDRDNFVTIIKNSSLLLNKSMFPMWSKIRFSIFSWNEKCSGIDIEGAKYPLKNATLSNSFPIGVSNEFDKDSVVITCKSGKLLVIVSNE